MTAAVARLASGHSAIVRGGRGALRIMVAVVLGPVLAIALVSLSGWVTSGEAGLNGHLVDLLGLADAHHVGSAVVFPLHGRWVGFAVTGGCSVVLPLLPPLLLASALLAIGRVSLIRAVLAAAGASALLVAVNQLRLSIIVGSMRLWGFQTGYERSHVLIGSVVATLGLAAVAMMFVLLLGGGRRRGPAAHRLPTVAAEVAVEPARGWVRPAAPDGARRPGGAHRRPDGRRRHG